MGRTGKRTSSRGSGTRRPTAAARNPSSRSRTRTRPSKPARAARNAAKSAPSRAPRAAPANALVPAGPSRDAPHWTETLLDGTRVIIRPIRREDAALERAFLRRLSPESRRLRFLGQVSEAGDDLIRTLTDIDYRRDRAFIALVHRGGEKRVIGVARYSADDQRAVCECAVTVADEWRNRGLAVALMRHLIEVARSRGMRSMFSVDEADNAAMRELAKFLGFRRTRDPDDASQVIHILTLQ